MAYFDLENASHKGLIRRTYHASPELEAVVAQVEADILAQYTGRPLPLPPLLNSEFLTVMPAYLTGFYTGTPGDMVALIGYDPDPALANERLVNALVATVADVANWRLAQAQVNPLEKSRSTDMGKSVSFRDDASEPFPPKWSWRLTYFEIGLDIGGF